MTALISPTHFADRMASHWRDLGNVTSPALKKVWEQMALAFGKHILDDDGEDRSRWTVLQPPTGTGKTRGTALYAAMLAPYVQQGIHPGVLILKTMTADVDDLVGTINGLAGLTGYAVAMHSALPTRPDPEGIRRAPVLCTTHASYRLALAGLCAERSDETASPLLGWHLGRRKLVVIDECLEPVHVHSISASEVEHLKAEIPPALRDRYPAALDWLQSLIAAVDDARSTPGGRVHQWLNASLKGDARAELKALRPDLRRHLESEQLLGMDKSAAVKATGDVLQWLVDMGREEVLYTPRGARDELTAAALALPDGIKGAVVLDATASTNALYRHYERADLLDSPAGTRSYANVTVHVSTGHAVGKTTMTQDPMKLLQPALQDLSNRLGGRKALLITHKACETSVKLIPTPGLDIELTHWGAITGSNAWRDLDAVLILGVPQRPNHWATAALLKLNDRTYKEDERRTAKRELVLGQTVTELIQGINRIRCRKVVDERGNCEPCDVYVALESSKDAEEILGAIRDQMPGVHVRQWQIGPTMSRRAGRPPARAQKAADAVIHVFHTTATQSLDRAQAQAQIPGLDAKGWEALAKATRDEESYTAKALEQAGLVFFSPGPGKRATVMRAM